MLMAELVVWLMLRPLLLLIYAVTYDTMVSMTINGVLVPISALAIAFNALVNVRVFGRTLLKELQMLSSIPCY